MLDVRFFKNPRFSGASFAVTLVFFAMLGVSFLLTQYLQFVLGFSPLRAGLGFIPLATVLMVAAPMSAPLTKRFASKLVVSGGLAIVGGALLMLSQATVHSGYTYVGLVLALLGLGLGTAMSPATDSIMGSLPKEKAGVGSAVNDTTRQVGGALGVAVLGSLAAATYHAKIAGSKVYASLPGPARAAARDSIGGALQAAPHLGAAGHQLIADASAAFVHAMSVSSMVAGVAALGGALVALLFLPARAGDEDMSVAPADGDRVPTGPKVIDDGRCGRPGGVSTATLYRRWPSKLDLVVGVLTKLSEETPIIDTGTLAGDLTALLNHSAAKLAGEGGKLFEG
jgi:Na+/melibiose symporter-like transporter